MIIVVGSARLTICIGDILSSKCEVCTGKNRVHPYPPRPYPYPTRPVKSVPDPYPTRTRGSKTGKSAGTGIPADPYYIAIKIPSCGNGQEFLELDEQSKEAILIFFLHFLFSDCTVYTAEPRFDGLNIQNEARCSLEFLLHG